MKHVYVISRQTDMTEGRGPMREDFEVYESEQDAWDVINDLHGVQGSKPPNCYPSDKLKAAGATTWQDYARVVGYGGDYSVHARPVVAARYIEETT